MAIVILRGENACYEFDPDDKSTILGQGNMGVVCRGKRIVNDTGKYEYVAIKIMFSDLSEDSINRAKQEASIRISHENIVQMYDFITTIDAAGNSRHHVISELLEGDTLDQDIKDNGLLSESQTINIIKSLLSALQMLHSRGYIHRDIKPSNIMVCNNGSVKIIDFGIAKLMSTYQDECKDGTLEGCFIGTAYYASPEQAEGKHWITNGTSDIYSTGILLFELLVGRLPFDGTTYEIITGHRKEPINVPDSYNATLKYIISKACAKEQKDRYQSASEFIVDLEKYERGEKVIPSKINFVLLSVIASVILILVVTITSVLVISSNSKEREIDARSKLISGQYSASQEIYKTIMPIFRSDEAKLNLERLELVVPAFRYYNQSKYNEADSLFRLATRLNSSDAYYYLGEMSFEGIGAPKNYDAGIEYASRAAELGNKLAEYRLGVVYKYGLGVKIDQVKALDFFEKAGKAIDEGVENNNPELLFIKGSMYFNGNYVQKNRARAIECYTKSANLNYPQAQYELSVIIEDSLKSYEYLKKSAMQGYPKAEYDMGIIASRSGDLQNTLEWMQKSVDHCYSPAFQWFGTLYADNYSSYAQLLSLTTTLDDVKAHKYAEKALEYDFENIYSMIDLWSDYSVGRGVEKNQAKADMYKNMAAKKLDEFDYVETGKGNRIYSSRSIQKAWNWLYNNK